MPSRFIILARDERVQGNMRIQYHKILSEGRSVRYNERDEDILHLNVIVTEDDLRRSRVRRSA